MPKRQLARWGNDLAVRIPKSVAAELRLKVGEWVSIHASEGQIELLRATPTLEELAAGITPENRHGEADWGPDVGNEIIK